MNSLSERMVDGRSTELFFAEHPKDPIVLPIFNTEAEAVPQAFPANIFYKIKSQGHMDANGIANPSLMEVKFPAPIPSSSKRLMALTETVMVFPDKKLAEIPERKRELVERALEELEKEWLSSGIKREFPFVLNKERTHLSIHITFCYRELLEFIEGLSFVKSLECYGGGLPYVLGEEYFDTACSSLIEERDDVPCERPESWLVLPDDLDLAMECSSEDFDPYKTEEHILSFLAGKIPHTEKEEPLLYIILRETAFKNIFVSHTDFKNPQTLISLHNKCGIDIDLTFSKKINRTPFTVAHGLRAFVSFKKNSEGLISLFCEDVNPYQCLFDKMASVYRVVEKIERSSFERRIPWLLQVMSKGGTLALGEKRDWLKEGLCLNAAPQEICKLHRKSDSDDEHDFLVLMDVLNGLSFLLENGCEKQGGMFCEAVLPEIQNHPSKPTKNKELSLQILKEILLSGSDAPETLLHLRSALLYVLPFYRSASGFTLRYGKEGPEGKSLFIFDLFCRNKKRALHLPMSLAPVLSRISSENADRWLSLLIQDSTLTAVSSEPHQFEAVKHIFQAKREEEQEETGSRIGKAYACETALFGNMGINWRGFLEARPLTYLLTNPSFEERQLFIRRINGRLQIVSGKSLSNLEGFLTERKSRTEVAKQFLCEMLELSETATHAMKEELMDELWSELEASEREDIIAALIGYLLVRNSPLAASFLKSAVERGFPFSKAAPFLLKVLESEEIAFTPYRAYAAGQIVRMMLDNLERLPSIATPELLFKAILSLCEEDKTNFLQLLLKAEGKGFHCPVERGLVTCLIAEMQQDSREREGALTELLEKASPDLCKALVLHSKEIVVQFLIRVFQNGSKIRAYELLRKLDGSSCLEEMDSLKEILLFGLDQEVMNGRGMHVYKDLERGPLAHLAPPLKHQTTILAVDRSLNEGRDSEAAYGLATVLKEEFSEESDAARLAELIERLIQKNIEAYKGEQAVHERIKEILFHPCLANHIGKDKAGALLFYVAERALEEGKRGYFDLLPQLLPSLAAFAWNASERDVAEKRLLKLAHAILSHPQKKVFAKRKPSQALLNYLYEVLPKEMKDLQKASLLLDYFDLISDCERFPRREKLSLALAALSALQDEPFQKGVRVVLKILPLQFKKLEMHENQQETAEGLKKLASSSLCRGSPEQLIHICKLGFPLFKREGQIGERREVLLCLKSAGFSRFKDIKEAILQSGFLPGSEEVVDLIMGLLMNATDEEIVSGINLLEPFLKESSCLESYVKKELSYTGIELIDCAIRLESGDAFAELLTIFDLHSFALWVKGSHLLGKHSKKCTASFVAFFTSSFGQVEADNAGDYFTLLGKLASENKSARTVFPLTFLEEAMRVSTLLKGADVLTARVLALDAYLLSIQKSQNAEEMAVFWKWREALADDDERVHALDVQALMHMTTPVKQECAVLWLNAFVRLYLNNKMSRVLALKALALLESLAFSDSWKDQGYALSRHLLDGCHLKNEERIRLLKVVNPYLLHFKDALSLYKSISVVLSAVENSEFVPKGASAEIPLSDSLALMPHDFASSVLAHRQLTCIFSSSKIKEALNSFLFEIASSALTNQNREEALKALLEYEKYFCKLEIGSSNEREITTLIIQIYAFLMGKDKSNKICIGHFTNLARETLIRINMPQLADIALDVTLWCPDRAVTRESTKQSINSHINNKSLQKFKDRFFEMAKEMVGVFLSMPSDGEEQDTAVLKACVSLVSNIMRGNIARGERLLPEFERLMFSPLSQASYSLFVTHLRECKRILATCMEKGYMRNNAEIFYTALLLIENKDWLNHPLTKEKRKALINTVFDYLLSSGNHFVLHHVVSIMQMSSLLLFQQDDLWRSSVFLRLIEGAFNHPQSTVIIVSFDDKEPVQQEAKECTHPLLNTFFTPKEQLALKKEGGRLKEELLLKTVAECMVNDERQIIHVQKGSTVDTAYSLIQAYSQKMKALVLAAVEERTNFEELLKIHLKFLTHCHKYQLFPNDEIFWGLVEECFRGPVLTCITNSKILLEYFGILIRLPIKNPEVRIRRLELYHRVVKDMLCKEDRAQALLGKLFLEEGIKANVYQGNIQIISGDSELKELLDKLI